MEHSAETNFATPDDPRGTFQCRSRSSRARAPIIRTSPRCPVLSPYTISKGIRYFKHAYRGHGTEMPFFLLSEGSFQIMRRTTRSTTHGTVKGWRGEGRGGGHVSQFATLLRFTFLARPRDYVASSFARKGFARSDERTKRTLQRPKENVI